MNQPEQTEQDANAAESLRPESSIIGSGSTTGDPWQPGHERAMQGDIHQTMEPPVTEYDNPQYDQQARNESADENTAPGVGPGNAGDLED